MKRGNLFTTIESQRYHNDHGELVLTNCNIIVIKLLVLQMYIHYFFHIHSTLPR
jgi:hypothetical protein